MITYRTTVTGGTSTRADAFNEKRHRRRETGVMNSIRRIIVVDNHPLTLTFLKLHLEKEGYEVKTARSGLEALDIIKYFTPDVMFIDLIMPNINGIKLCKIIRSMPELDHIYIIILSAIAAEKRNGLLDVFTFGADTCIAKGPFQKMKQHIKTALDRALSGTDMGANESIIGLDDTCPRVITSELLSGNHHYEVILNGMTEGIMEVTAEGRIVYANPAAVSLAGTSEESLLATHFHALFRKQDQATVQSVIMNHTLPHQTTVNNGSFIINDRQVECKFLPLEEDGYTQIVILDDVTEQKQREAQIRHAQKMEAIGTLAGGIAHDFNNLLMGIQGNISLMLINAPDGHPDKRRLGKMEDLIDRGSKLTAQLLGYAQEGKYEIKPINLNDLVNKTADTIARTRKDITVRRFLTDPLFTVKADRGQIEQTLLNIMINASEAMPDGGTLHITTKNITATDRERPKGFLMTENYVMIDISDTGIGIDDAIIEKIFDPFFTTKGMGRATGLGLASAMGIIKGHHGNISVDSEKGKGTSFKIYLPETPALHSPQQHRKTGSSDKVLKKPTILLVDDEMHVLDVGRDMLTALGYHVLTASNGSEAVETYMNHGNMIDLVLLDMVMPAMGGREAFIRLKEIKESVKVLLVSGHSIDGEATEIMEQGCNGFIQKPFNMETLHERIKDILNPTQA
ncbi:MAG: response regulator [Deltaproteobacteria bacterium]|nr:response regulator [Deltaproteobacteria bacterium]MBN2686672.1 response regulator [Deltaproteobacteria bacterium]